MRVFCLFCFGFFVVKNSIRSTWFHFYFCWPKLYLNLWHWVCALSRVTRMLFRESDTFRDDRTVSLFFSKCDGLLFFPFSVCTFAWSLNSELTKITEYVTLERNSCHHQNYSFTSWETAMKYSTVEEPFQTLKTSNWAPSSGQLGVWRKRGDVLRQTRNNRSSSNWSHEGKWLILKTPPSCV